MKRSRGGSGAGGGRCGSVSDSALIGQIGRGHRGNRDGIRLSGPDARNGDGGREGGREGGKRGARQTVESSDVDWRPASHWVL